MGTRQWSRLLIATMIVTTVTMLSVSAVSAHARPKTTDPVDKATVTKAPAQYTIVFSEETNPTKSGGSVTDASGAVVSTGFKVDLNERTKMTIDLKPNLPNDTYTVKWNSFTDDDSGTADGTLTFTIQAQATGTGTAPAGGSATAGTAPTATAAPAVTATSATTVAPTVAPAATVAPTATRPAPTAVATGTGGGTVAATSSPSTLPKTGNSAENSGAPWAMLVLTLAAIAIATGLAFRFRAARR